MGEGFSGGSLGCGSMCGGGCLGGRLSEGRRMSFGGGMCVCRPEMSTMVDRAPEEIAAVVSGDVTHNCKLHQSQEDKGCT